MRKGWGFERMTRTRHLIVNADDFGLSPDVNRGIIEAHARGIVTSTSLMVRRAAAAEAGAWFRDHPMLAIGLHLDLCEWEYADDEWRMVYEVVPLKDSAAVAVEIRRQIEMFHQLMGTPPTHLDSHQHVHHSPPICELALDAARELGVPLRATKTGIHYCGEFYGQSNKGYPYPEGISVDALLKVLARLPAGITELGCHPAAGMDFESAYRPERVLELQTLCDPRVREALQQEAINLCSFRNWREIADRKT